MEKWEIHNTALLKISAHLYGACDHMFLLKWQNNVIQDHCQLKDNSEYLMVLIEVINKGSIPYCDFNDVRKIYCLRCLYTEISLIWV